MPTLCYVKDCDAPVASGGMCGKHHQRFKRTGSPLEVRRLVGASSEERFWLYVQKTPTCWLWTGGVSHTYGVFHVQIDGKDHQVAAHRFAYELLVGPIPKGLTIDHTCHTPSCQLGLDCPHRRCINPAHLKPATLPENIQRSGNGTKTHCKRGHEFTPENTFVMQNGGRSCRICQRMHDANRRERHRVKRQGPTTSTSV